MSKSAEKGTKVGVAGAPLLISIGRGADIWGPAEARMARTLAKRGFLRITPAVADPAGEHRQPYFGAVITATGRSALKLRARVGNIVGCYSLDGELNRSDPVVRLLGRHGRWFVTIRVKRRHAAHPTDDLSRLDPKTGQFAGGVFVVGPVPSGCRG